MNVQTIRLVKSCTVLGTLKKAYLILEPYMAAGCVVMYLLIVLINRS